jgi:hypothetical protein
LTERSTIRRPLRLIAAALLVAFSGALAGCSSGFGTNFDPTDLLDWLDTKKKLPGERKPVFPSGVPGLDQGVPKDLYKNNVERQQQLDQQNAAAAATQPAEPPPPAATGKKGSKGKQPATAAAAPADQPAAEPNGEADVAGQEDATPAAPPPPKPKKIVRKRTTAPPPDQPPAQSAQQAPSAFPAPLPGGSFTR